MQKTGGLILGCLAVSMLLAASAGLHGYRMGYGAPGGGLMNLFRTKFTTPKGRTNDDFCAESIS